MLGPVALAHPLPTCSFLDPLYVIYQLYTITIIPEKTVNPSRVEIVSQYLAWKEFVNCQQNIHRYP